MIKKITTTTNKQTYLQSLEIIEKNCARYNLTSVRIVEFWQQLQLKF